MNEITQAEYQEAKQTSQGSRTTRMKNKEKYYAQNSTPNRFPVNLEKLNRHYKGLRRLNNPQNSPNNH
jgi:hypothetical protein